MNKIFEEGEFRRYSNISLNSAKSPILEYSQFSHKTTVFISHKHDDLDNLKGVLGFLEQNYNVKVYIDSKDSSMPITTSSETAKKLKDRIRQCDRFILLATNGAIASKWCNWELGFGDANKFPDQIAIFPMKPEGANDKDYKGSEYMRIYPYIDYFDGSERDNRGLPIPRGYYVVENKDESRYYTPLDEWFSKTYIG